MTDAQIAKLLGTTKATIDQVRAFKDAKGDFFEATKLMDETDLLWYSGDDVVNLAWLALGAVGVVSVVGHVAGNEFRAMIDAVDAGDLATARAIHTKLIPAIDALMNTSQGAIMVKAALRELGLPAGPVRPPMVDATPEQIAQLRADLASGGVPL